jgi:hypothetical protein
LELITAGSFLNWCLGIREVRTSVFFNFFFPLGAFLFFLPIFDLNNMISNYTKWQ